MINTCLEGTLTLGKFSGENPRAGCDASATTFPTLLKKVGNQAVWFQKQILCLRAGIVSVSWLDVRTNIPTLHINFLEAPFSLNAQAPTPQFTWTLMLKQLDHSVSALKTYKPDWNKTNSRFEWLYTNMPQTHENVHSPCSLQRVETCAGWIWSKYLAGRFLSSALILHIKPNPLSKLFAFCKFS